VLRFAAHHLLPAVGGGIELRPVHFLREDRAGGVVDGDAFTARLQPVGVRDHRARGSAVPGKHHVIALRDRGEIGNLAIIGGQHLEVGQLELLHRVLNPDIAEALPRRDRHRARGIEHRPHRRFDRAGVRCGHDAHQIIIGDAEQFAGEVDRVLQTRLAQRRTVRAAERFGFELVQRPAGEFCRGTRGKKRALRLKRRLVCEPACILSHVFSPCRELARRWDRVARGPL